MAARRVAYEDDGRNCYHQYYYYCDIDCWKKIVEASVHEVVDHHCYRLADRYYCRWAFGDDVPTIHVVPWEHDTAMEALCCQEFQCNVVGVAVHSTRDDVEVPDHTLHVEVGRCSESKAAGVLRNDDAWDDRWELLESHLPAEGEHHSIPEEVYVAVGGGGDDDDILRANIPLEVHHDVDH